MTRKILLVTLCLVVAVAGYMVLAATGTKSAVSVATAAGKTYTGTLYVAGMGGHFAQVAVTIDPSNAGAPIKVTDLGRVEIGNKTTHPTHDARVDSTDSNTMFWSTYKTEANGMVHVGKSDLKTGNKLVDIALPIDPRTKGPAPMYCASGQSKSTFMPVMMGSEAYIDVFDKKTLDKKHRLYVSDLGYKPGTYKFVHGVNTPDMKHFIISINLINTEGKFIGKSDLVMVDLKEMEKGKLKQIKKVTITGDPAKTISFRQTFTADGKLFLQSGADRMYLIDAKSLKVLDEEMMVDGGENHDVLPTPDGKYAILTLRKPVASMADPEGKSIMDGTIQLYDIKAKKLVGNSVSACYDCHKNAGIHASTALCGLDAVFTK